MLGRVDAWGSTEDANGKPEATHTSYPIQQPHCVVHLLTPLLVARQGNVSIASCTRGLSVSIHLRLPFLVFSMSCFSTE